MACLDDLTLSISLRRLGVARRLSFLRKSRRLKQEYVAACIGIPVSTLSGYEIGKSAPPYEILIRLAALYEVSCDYLLRGGDLDA